MTIKRFVYIGSPSSDVVHIHRGKLLEGEATDCGVRLRKGWKWIRHSGPPHLSQKRVCSRCVSAER